MSQTPRYEQVAFEREAGSTEILLVRHAQSAPFEPGRPFEIVHGRGDPALSPLGEEQVQKLFRRLRNFAISAIYVTPLRRTSQTAAPLAHALGITPSVEPDLVEVDLGEWEGGSYRMHVAERHPIVLEMRKLKRWDVIPGAESNESLTDRTTGAIRKIAQRHPGEQVLVVAHAGSIASVLAYAAEAPIFSFLGVGNASFSSIVVKAEQWDLRRFNDTTHLEDES